MSEINNPDKSIESPKLEQSPAEKQAFESKNTEFGNKLDNMTSTESSEEPKKDVSDIEKCSELAGQRDSFETKNAEAGERLDSLSSSGSPEEKQIEPCEQQVDKAEKAPEQIKCRNESLEGQEHPETGVPFERKQVEVDGKEYEVVVPEFDSFYDAQLPKNMYEATDRVQFKECNSQLKNEVANNKDLREQFDDEQLEQIENGDTPDGYTWHHDAEVGKMQLVDTEIHQKTGHTGGRSIWGGGTESR